MLSMDERIAYLRERNARNCNRRSPTEATSSLLVVDPRDTEGWKLRRSALLRGYFPLVAPPPATVVAHAEDAPGETDKSRAMSSALIAIAQSTSAKEAPPPLHELSNPRRRPRSDESSAIITIDPALLREQTRRAQEQHGVASSVPQQQPHWKMSKVLTGHRGWVRAVAVDPANEWFCTGANDTIIKVWDMSSGASKVNLIGHKEAVRGLAVSALSPYLYSCGDDHAVKCWDLERNECIRDFHGHGGAVFSVAAHPGLDIIISGSRDKTVRVWDVRSRASVHTLTGHSAPVLTVAAQSPEPQIISGGDDCMIYLWDLAAGKALTRLTRHRKPVRQVVPHFGEQTLLSCGADNIRKWKLPEGDFLTNLNLTTAPRPADTSSASIWTCCAVSKRNTVFVGSDDGQLMFFDWESHSLFQATKTKALAGALESERGICCGAFDVSGTRLVTGESDKTVKIWKRKDEVAS